MEESTKKAIDAGVNTIDFTVGLFTGISPLGPIKSIGEYVFSIKGRRLEKNIKIFVSTLQDLKEKDYNEFYKTIEEDPQDFKEKILLQLEELDEPEKARITGNLTKARIKGKISRKDYLRLCSVVSKSFVDDVKWLSYLSNQRAIKFDFQHTVQTMNEKHEFKKTIDIEVTEQNLFGLGLVNQKIKANQNSTEHINQEGERSSVTNSVGL